MRSRDLLLSAADYDWVTNYYTKWITGHEVQKTDTRYTMYVTHWTTEWTETITVTEEGEEGEEGTPSSGESDWDSGNFADILGAWGAHIMNQVLSAYKKKSSSVAFHGSITPGEIGKQYFSRGSVSTIKNDYLNQAYALGYNSDTVWDIGGNRQYGFESDLFDTAWDIVSSWSADLDYEPGSPGTPGTPGHTTTKKVIRKRQTQRETVRQTTFKYYYWTYYQTSQATTRVTKWYTDKYSDTKMTGVDPNQRYQGHLLSVTYYDRSDESSTEYGYVGENEHEKVPVIRTGAYMPKIGSLPNRQAIDPNSNKWMESREDRQANQGMSKNVYSKNKNELLNSQSNKRNLQTYYVHNEEQETSSGVFGAVTK